MVVVDLFCGAGGVTAGFNKARDKFGRQVAYVAVAVNHSQVAIESHEANHPETVHFNEDIWFTDLNHVRKAVMDAMSRFPGANLVIWMSAECTNFSRAKGGKPRDPKSRTLPASIFRYIRALNPDVIYVENVEEFMSWGPLVPKVVNAKGEIGAHCPIEYDKKEGSWNAHLVPESKHRGRDYMRWRKLIEACGFRYESRLLVCADYGACTIRKRYFGIGVRHGQETPWPEQTHADPKKFTPGVLEIGLKPWRPVSEVLDFDDEGQSIFDRKTPLVENTLERIHAGLVKFVAGGRKQFMTKYYSGSPESRNYELDRPAHTLTCWDHGALVFINKYYGNGVCVPVSDPAPTLTTKDRLACVWVERNFSEGGHLRSVDDPAGSLLTNPKMNLVHATRFLMPTHYDNGCQSVNDPSGTITADRHYTYVINPQKPWLMDMKFKNVGNDVDNPAPTLLTGDHHYLMNPQYKSAGGSVDQPCFTLIARMDKAPPYLVAAESGDMAIVIYDTDSHWMRHIKIFMSLYGIVDIKMRSLTIPEMKGITGFSKDYVLKGTKNEQKEGIGNAVPVEMSEAFAKALHQSLTQ